MQSDIRQMLSWGLYKKDVAWGKRCCPCNIVNSLYKETTCLTK